MINKMRTSVMVLIGMIWAFLAASCQGIKQYKMHGRSGAWRLSEKRGV